MQTPRFQEQIYRQVYRQIFALHARSADTATNAKLFDINRLPPKICAIDDVSAVIFQNRQVHDRA